MDTTSGALARAFHVLSTHHDVQEKLRQEVKEAMQTHGEDLPYDVIMEMPYLDAICREILRLWVTHDM
jgi:cytochrome P450